MVTRRQALVGMASIAVGLAHSRGLKAAEGELTHTIAAQSDWFCNQVALTSKNELFGGLPRYPDHDKTPGLGRLGSNGMLAPFPGNSWNEWKPGDSGKEAFVYVNGMHIFADDTVWAVDQGALRADWYGKELSTPKPGAQKVVQLDSQTGKILNVLTWGEDILPPGGQLNDLRIFGSTVYLADSGLGGLIVHELSTGKTLRRLSGRPEVMAVNPPTDQGQHVTPKSDMVEVTADGAWLYWAAPTGPFRRVPTKLLRDPNVSDDELVKSVELVGQIARSGGCAIDTKGNLYLSELDNKRITILSPSGKTAVLTSDEEFISLDGSFISVDRVLYTPSTQSRRTRLFGNATDMIKKPWKIYATKLPKNFDGIELGDQVNGKATS